MRSLEASLARSTLGAYLAVRPGEPLTIESWSHAVPWARAFVVEARRLAAEPLLVVEDEDGFFTSLASASHGPVPRSPADLARRGGAYVYFEGPEQFPRLFGLRTGELAAAVRRHAAGWERRARASRLRAARMVVSGATSTAATRFGVDLDAWRQEIVRASVVPPQRLVATAETRLRRLREAKELRLCHGNGTDLKVRLRARAWVEELGPDRAATHRSDPVWRRIPAGALTVPVVPGSAEGTWESNRPEYDRYAEVPVGRGARFSFAGGRLADASFDRGGEAFHELFRHGRSFQATPVAIRFGLNPKISRAPEVGELAAGSVTLVLARQPGARRVRGTGATYVSVLAGPDAELDGARWLDGGQPRAR